MFNPFWAAETPPWKHPKACPIGHLGLYQRAFQITTFRGALVLLSHRTPKGSDSKFMNVFIQPSPAVSWQAMVRQWMSSGALDTPAWARQDSAANPPPLTPPNLSVGRSCIWPPDPAAALECNVFWVSSDGEVLCYLDPSLVEDQPHYLGGGGQAQGCMGITKTPWVVGGGVRSPCQSIIYFRPVSGQFFLSAPKECFHAGAVVVVVGGGRPTSARLSRTPLDGFVVSPLVLTVVCKFDLTNLSLNFAVV